MNQPLLNRKTLTGILLILYSALAFYGATAVIKIGSNRAGIPVLLFVASRFWAGYLLLQVFFPGKPMVPVNRKWLWMRASFNTAAVFFFFLGVSTGTVTGANLLNMTYPAFVALFAPFMIREKSGWADITGIIMAVTGAWLVSTGGRSLVLAPGDFYGLVSGILAGVAIVSLRQIRKTDSTRVILLYNFRLGSWLILPAVLYYVFTAAEIFTVPEIWLYITASAVIGFSGQITLTYGFRYVSAVEGSVLSSSRILIALIAGFMFFDEQLTAVAVAGAVLIFIANVLIPAGKTLRNRRNAGPV